MQSFPIFTFSRQNWLQNWKSGKVKSCPGSGSNSKPQFQGCRKFSQRNLFYTQNIPPLHEYMNMNVFLHEHECISTFLQLVIGVISKHVIHYHVSNYTIICNICNISECVVMKTGENPTLIAQLALSATWINFPFLPALFSFI